MIELPVDWEALGDGSQVVCPDCLTASEQQAIDAMEAGEEADLAMWDAEVENREP